jgi:hypothetical protein
VIPWVVAAIVIAAVVFGVRTGKIDLPHAVPAATAPASNQGQ